MEVLNSLTSLADLPARYCGREVVRVIVDLGSFLSVVQIFRSLFPEFFWLSLFDQGRDLCLQRYNS